MSYRQKSGIKLDRLHQITLRTQLQIQTLQPKKYLKCINELQSDDGHINKSIL